MIMILNNPNCKINSNFRGGGMTPPPWPKTHRAIVQLQYYYFYIKMANYNYKLFSILIFSVRWQCKDPLADTIAQLKAYTYISTKGKHTDWYL